MIRPRSIRDKKGIQKTLYPLYSFVGARRFELPTPCTPCKCATRLRYAPNRRALYQSLCQFGMFSSHFARMDETLLRTYLQSIHEFQQFRRPEMTRYFTGIHFAMLDSQFPDRRIPAKIKFVERYPKSIGTCRRIKIINPVFLIGNCTPDRRGNIGFVRCRNS